MNPPGPQRPRSPRERLIVALDLPDRRASLALVETLGDEVLWYKVGMELFYAEGASFLDELAHRGKHIFLDLKLHDIPNTMGSALRSLCALPVALTTVHVPAGIEALRACAEQAKRGIRPGQDGIGLLGVTRLTSLPPPDPEDPYSDVVALAGIAIEAGLYGWIAPAAAGPRLREAYGPTPALVTPGIRLPEEGRQDQVSVGTPEEAVRGGADWIVVGRPVTRAEDPAGAAREILRRLGESR
jgi:orotidine-5'-phosphate decarboxylase